MAITPSQWSHVLTIPESYTPSAATSGQTLVITESVIAKLSAGDQSTFWSNVLNGGGDVRICTDSAGANQLPVEIVSLDNVAETCVIWTRKATYAGTGELYVFIGKAGETQPAVTDQFGRNAVWVDYEVVLHMQEVGTNGAFTDSTSNGRDTTLTSGASLPTTTINHPFGASWPDFDASQFLSILNSAQCLNNSEMHMSAWVDVDLPSNVCGLVGNRYQAFGDSNWFQLQSNLQGFVKGNSVEDYLSGTGSSGISCVTLGHDSSSLISYKDGTFRNQDSTIANPSGINSQVGQDYRIGTYFDGVTGRSYNGRIGEVRLAKYKPSLGLVATEYANQSDPATFYGTPTLASTGGGGTATLDANVTLPSLTATGTASATLPQPILSASINLTQLSATGSASATLPNPELSANIALPILTVAGIAAASLPNPALSASITLPTITVSGNASATLPGFNLSGNITLPVITATGAAQATLPQPTLTATVNLPTFTVTGSATATEPSFTLSGNVTLPTLAVTGAASATLPQPTLSGNITLPNMQVSGFLVGGEIVITIDASTNINEPTLSTNITEPTLSTNISE